MGQAAFLNSLLGQAAFLNSLNSPLASGSVGTDCSVYSQSAPHCAGSEVREEAQETQEESKRPGSVGTEVLHSEQSRLYTANSQDSTQRTVKTLHSEQLQSTRDCGSINISKRGKSQERRLYTANSSSLQETVGAEASPREVSVKKEDSTQQPKLSLQETAEE